jgi:hypothetical protein
MRDAVCAAPHGPDHSRLSPCRAGVTTHGDSMGIKYPVQSGEGVAPDPPMPEDVDRCPHCMVDQPNMEKLQDLRTYSRMDRSSRYWQAHACARCGGVMMIELDEAGGLMVFQRIPPPPTVDAELPDRARRYLEQATHSLHAPAGAVMLAASAVDAMLKARGYSKGSLYDRIQLAAAEHLITDDMAKWAHDVRLDANEQRHADEEYDLPDPADARRVVEFASALGQFLFVLPARVRRGLRKPSA